MSNIIWGALKMIARKLYDSFNQRINPLGVLFAISFYILENRYFGWNKLPQSQAEVIADGIVVILLAISLRTRVIATIRLEKKPAVNDDPH